MIGLFFIPLLPAGRVRIWRCETCNGPVAPNQDGIQFKNVLLFNSVVAAGGIVMFALFAFLAFYVGGKGSAFDPGNIKATKGFLAFFAFSGLCIVVKALFDSRKIALSLSLVVKLSAEKQDVLARILQPGDTLPVVVEKLANENFTEAEIRTYTDSWSVPLA